MGLTFTNTAATTVAVANRICTVQNMKVGDYTITNASPVWAGGALITITHATVAVGTDTLGTVTITGKDLSGQTISEVMTPIADNVATSSKVFRSVTVVTGAGWVIAGGNDTITVGVAAGNVAAAGAGSLGGILVNNTVATLVTIKDGSRTIMVIPASQAAGTYYRLGGVDFISALTVLTTSTNDVTVFHTPTLPSSYAFS